MRGRQRVTVADAGELEGAYDTTRVPLSPADLTHRAAQRAAAHRYLNRRFTPDVAAELADMLGLLDDAPTREPGRCECGAELVLVNNYHRTARNRRRCGACAKAAG